MKYTIELSEKQNFWVCTDTENLVVCVFENKNFNDNQNFTTIENFDPSNFIRLAQIARLMGDWLRENHYDKIF